MFPHPKGGLPNVLPQLIDFCLRGFRARK